MPEDQWPQHYASIRGQAKPVPEARPADVESADKHGDAKKAARLTFGCFVNLTKSIAGAGILCLPFTLQLGGAGMSLLMMVITGGVSLLGFLSTGYACHLTGAKTYREAWERTVGASSAGVVDTMIVFECGICCVGYIILILDYLCIGIQGLVAVSVPRHTLAAIITIFFLMPLCLQPNFSSLRFSSLFGNFAILYTILFVILECVSWGEYGTSLRRATFLGPDRDGIIRSICVMTSAYIAHYSAPGLFAELSAHPRPWTAFCRSSVAAFGLNLLCYVAFSVAGFARFSPAVLGNILLNYDSGCFVMLAWVSMATCLILTFPLQHKLVRDTIASTLQLVPMQKSRICELRRDAWSLLSVAVLLGTVVAGVVLTDISQVLSFRGALLGCPISFILPALMLLNAPTSTGKTRTSGEISRTLLNFSSCLLLVFGSAASVLGVYCVLHA